MRKLFENLNRRDKISVSLAASKKVFLALCHDWRCVFSTAWLQFYSGETRVKWIRLTTIW
jgi:hypothetical protein